MSNGIYPDRSTPWIDRSADPRSADGRFSASVSDRHLIVVSNRQPYSHEFDGERICVDRPTGGLTASLDPVMQQTGGTWIAWGDGDRDFDVVDGNGCVAVPPGEPEYRLKRLWLSDEEVSDYYDGFSNQVLWPLCHSALTKVRAEGPFWQRYCEVNERFAAAVADRARGRPLVWFHDYHLALAPKLARSRLPDGALLMHFWHVPWPAWDTFRACPHGGEILDGLLANDVLAFHTARYRTNFLRCVEAGVESASIDWEANDVSYRGRTTSVEAIPMGVPVDRIRRAVASSPGSFWQSFADDHGISEGTRIAVGVDRLDYTKGIVERLGALEWLWEHRPEWRGELTYVQNGSESRSRIPAYRDVQQSIADAIDRVNRRFGTDDWQPVVSVDDRLDRAELYELYRRADVALVTPTRDGMNLVAQEYVAAQTDGDGTLVLSDQAGLHDELGEHAVTVNPFDRPGLADAIDRALSMSYAERRHRLHHLQDRVRTRDLDAWLADNLRAADVAATATRPAMTS
jgi:trehalose 6-phosphate synthase